MFLEPLKHDVVGDVSEMTQLGPVDEAVDGRGAKAKVESSSAGGCRTTHKFCWNAVSVNEAVKSLQRCLDRRSFSCASCAKEEDAQRFDEVKIVLIISRNQFTCVLQENIHE